LQEEFRYTYILGRDAYAAAKAVYNPMFVGQSIHGTVIKTGGDAVRLYLKIDKKQDVSTAHPYPWVPDTGSFWKVPLRLAPAEKCPLGAGYGKLLESPPPLCTGGKVYCMPETGTKMSLYFPDEDERNVIVVNCIRQNGTTVNICAVENIELFAKRITVNSP